VSLVASGRSILSGAGHSALWVSAYVGGCTICLADLGGARQRPLTIGVAVSLALCVYILDRVKLSDARLDPADRVAHPDRFRFVVRHAGLLRLVALGAGVAALVGAVSLHPIACIACVGAGIGVVVYAGGRWGARHPRVKDRLLVKNMFVATGITALCVALVAAGAQVRWRDLLIGAGAVLLVVLGDSILCDIPDAESDARFGTHTIPNTFGSGWAWPLALCCHFIAVLPGYVLWASSIEQRAWFLEASLLWPLSIAASTALLLALRPRQLRDIVDARMGLFGAIALMAA